VCETSYENLADLARLPYFDIVDGALQPADPDLGPIIDVHTHLALTYGTRTRIDLRASHDRTLTFLPPERALDLDVYMNRNFSFDDLERMRKDLVQGALTGGTMRRTHTTANLLRDMKRLGIVRSVLLAIDLPVLSRNSEDWIEASASSDALICFGSVHALSLRRRARLDKLKALGVQGIKVHPTVQMMAPDHPRVMKLYRLCGERALPIFFHCGPVGIEPALGRRLTQVRRYEKAVAENPGTTFVLGHSGSLQMSEGLDLCLRYPNVYLDLASQSVGNVREIVERAPEGRVMYGTDWPFYHQAPGLAKVLIATEGDEAARRAVLHDNAARLLGLAHTIPASREAN